MKNSSGFTLIEMIVVLTVISILSTMGIAAFSKYNQAQSLNSGTMGIMTMLSTARSRALSQVKPSSECPDGKVFEGYQIAVCDGLSNCEKEGSDFELQIICDGWHYIDGKKLPNNIKIDPDSKGKAFLFYALTGIVSVVPGSASRTIIINGLDPDKRTITIDGLGNIKVEPKI